MHKAAEARTNPYRAISKDRDGHERAFEFRFSKTGVSYRGETLEEFASRLVVDMTSGCSWLDRVEEVK